MMPAPEPADPAAPTFFVGGGEAGALIRAIDWSASPLGPIAGWPQSLRTAVSICIGSRFPIALYWGPELVMLYNDDLAPMIGAHKHPAAMGRPAFEVLPEVRDILEPLFRRVIRTGEATLSEDLMLPLLRHAVPEEAYFTFTYSPIRDESGEVGGVFCAAVETTDKVIEGRRLRLLDALASATQARTPAEACALAASQLALSPDDVPFAALYLLDAAAPVAALAGAVHVEPGSAYAPASISLGPGAVWPFEAAGGQAAHRVELADGPLGARGAVILAIERATGGRPLGFVVAGLSPLLRSAASYDRFHNLLAASISQTVRNAAAYQAERQRAEALARADAEMRAREQVQRGNLYRHFMQAPFPICVFQGPDHVLELANPPILRAWGKTAEAIGVPVLAAIPELRDQPFFGYLDGVYRTGVAYEGRAELARLPTGPAGALEDVYFNFVYAPLRDQTGAIEGVLVSAFDVTDQVRARNERAQLLDDERRARADAEAARARMEALFMIAPAPICMLEGPEHRFTLLNQPYRDLLRRDDLVGKTFAAEYPERVTTLARLDRVYATGETLRSEAVPFRPQPDQADPNLYDMIYQPFRNATGQVAGILLAAFDVTEVTRARQASEQARRDAEAAAQAQRAMVEFQERFVAILGHDLRNPLAAVDMAAGLLRQQATQAGNPTVNRIVGRIQSSSQRMSRMVEQILDLSRARVGGGLAIEPSVIDLCITLTSVVDELRMANPAAELVLRCAPALGLWDRDRLEQVFSNLIGNAIHHGLAGAPITVDVQPGDRHVRVVVHNQGPPISEPIRANLFSPFRRGDRDSRANKTAGLGLGLYISRELVLGHGGDIEVQSSAERGTTFVVTLPLAQGVVCLT